MKRPAPTDTLPPLEVDTILLHACCAPCSCAIVEALLAAKITPVLFYYNPNIAPLEEYQKRKSECMRFATSRNLRMIDVDTPDRAADRRPWFDCVRGLENEPERGARCLECFKMRLLRTAQMARELGIKVFATTLASSRWKDLSQIEVAGRLAEAQTGVRFWARNWRKGGLQQRRNELIKQYNFYNQLYCGCLGAKPLEPPPPSASACD